MSESILEVEAQRRRWADHRRHQHLETPKGDVFARGGLAGQVGNGLDLRLLCLPADPQGDVASLDREALTWLRQHRGVALAVRGHRERATVDALVVYDLYREDRPWNGYVALHRHGGVEIAVAGHYYTVRETRVFPLTGGVRLAWALAALQSDAAQRWAIAPPYELTVAVRNTGGVALGGFAEGWREPERGLLDYPRCLDEHLLLRFELQEHLDPGAMAIAVGDRLELAFGSTQRRHLAPRGGSEGRLDPSILDL